METDTRMDQPSYEETFGALSRRIRRVWRALRWRAKGVAGKPRRILVEIRWRLGDEIMALPIYEALQQGSPHDAISVWCTHPDLLIGNPHVDSVNQPCDPDRYILLRGAPRDIYRLAHYAQRAGVSVPHTQPRLYFEDWATPLLGEIEGTGPLVAVSTGASWATKRWPIAHWRVLCAALIESGARVVQLGKNDERIGSGTCLVDRTSVREAGCVLRAASVFVCCDSGLMHLALAAGARTVALFGPTDPSILIRDNPDLVVIRSERACHGCWNRAPEAFAEGTCPEGIEPCCLETIRPETVIARVRGCIERGPDG